MLAFNSLTYSFESIKVLNKITAIINDGEAVAITGNAGSGKTTLLKLIGGLYRNNSGSINIDGTETDRIPKHDLQKRIAFYSYTDDLKANPESTVREWVLDGRLIYKKFLSPYSDLDREISERQMEAFGVIHLSAIRLKNLPATSLRMCNLARLFTGKNSILLLDAPESGLNPEQRVRLSREIKKYGNSGHGIVVTASCDLNFIIQSCDSVIALQNGNIAERGPVGIITENFIKKYFRVDSLVTKNIVTGLPEIHIIETG